MFEILIYCFMYYFKVVNFDKITHFEFKTLFKSYPAVAKVKLYLYQLQH